MSCEQDLRNLMYSEFGRRVFQGYLKGRAVKRDKTETNMKKLSQEQRRILSYLNRNPDMAVICSKDKQYILCDPDRGKDKPDVHFKYQAVIGLLKRGILKKDDTFYYLSNVNKAT